MNRVLVFSLSLILALLFRLPPVFAFHENLPTHTPAPVSTTPGVEITSAPSPEASSFGLPEPADLDQRTLILYIVGLVAIVGLILYLTRSK